MLPVLLTNVSGVDTVDNQHRKIKGYRELSEVEIDLMNQIKEKGLELAELITAVAAHHNEQHQVADEVERERLEQCEAWRWRAMAKSHFQEGMMALTRSVAQPGFF